MTLADEKDATSALDAKAHRPVTGIRPRDAASIILIDCSGGTPKVLMGRRGSGHVFMPDVYVFPGGKRDARDHALPFAADLDPAVMERLCLGPAAPIAPSRARALALAAMRELCEETGATFGGADGLPDLSRLRYVARAITPPGNVRRYDTRFFLAFCQETPIDLTHLADTQELQDIRWLDIGALSGLKLPRITQTVLEDVSELMAAYPDLPFGTPVSFYLMRHGRFVRSRL
ncbi:NUDIX hydrolase [Neorhizobium alkalisoli]|uniref:8-oxo-dGTP pyrophosphatase MutT (NUDIX family) n=1 Tax=Neorhizobium alkalisoli TaxID=528178 RepID=A0A561R1X2_9HYPH|nr:NUDIX hydrolase [Neorhizobium alkalisoli]TWF56612.1 8-oxo-dGTP pyrophosphatase MutT (NUDIX family) [Neorhizobium alkalisoli]